MFQLTITMMVPNKERDYIYRENHKYYFEESEVEDMFDLIQATIKATKNEIEYTIRIIEEGQIEDEE